MKAVIQRVVSASVSVEGEIISSIGLGLCVLIGISRNDTKKDIDYMVRKILNLKLFNDDNNKRMEISVVDKGYEVLCLSQITLYHSLKGNRLDFHHAMKPELSEEFYKQFLSAMREQYKPDLVKEGRFGVKCLINIQNDGPVTIHLESPVTQESSKEGKKCKQNKTEDVPKCNDSDCS